MSFLSSILGLSALRSALAAVVGRTTGYRNHIQTAKGQERADQQRTINHKHQKAVRRRLSDHANACTQAYRQKGMQVLNGKGHNSLAGIPVEWK